MSKQKRRVRVISQSCIGPHIYDLRLACKEMVEEAVPGQFVSLYVDDAARLLPRPISICGIDREKGELRLVYRVTGEKTGTAEIAKLGVGDEIEVLGPLGNGFLLEDMGDVILIGGGIGIPPMLELMKQLPKAGKKTAVMGYRDNQLFLAEEFKAYGEIVVATEDGSEGVKGNVLDAIRERKIKGDTIMACGPTPMLRAIKAYAKENHIRCYISLEEKMACGVGACLACVCKTKEVDHHSQVNNRRICKDGPVFLAEEVEI